MTSRGVCVSRGRCLGVADGRPVIEACAAKTGQHWSYTLAGNLVNASGNKCLGQRPEQQVTKPCPGDLRAQSADADMVIAELKGR
jgi:hypothetical protein